MAVMKMVALTMIGPNEEMESVARQMVLMGGFQPLPIDFLIKDRAIRSKVTTEGNNPYDELLSKLSIVWKVAGELLPEAQPVPIDPSFNLQMARKKVDGIAGRLEAWEKRRDILSTELEELEATKIYVEALSNLGLSPAELAQAEFAITFFGRASAENFRRLEESSEESPLLPVHLLTKGDNVWFLTMTVPGYKEGAKKMLDAIYFKEFPLSGIAERLSGPDALKKVALHIKNHQRAIEGLSKAAKNILKDHYEEYEAFYSGLYTMQRVYDLCKGRGEISEMYILSGWIPEDTLEQIRGTIEEGSPKTSIVVEQVRDIPYSGIRIPTMLKNSKLVQAFQDVVGMYSVPAYGEFDPSPIVALTFVFFFGFMFGDVGHGALIFLGALYCQKKRIIKKSTAYIMKSAAVSSIVFGFLYGSVMGFEHVIPPLWLSPMKDTGTLLVTAIAVGMGMVSLGMILNMFARYRDRDFGRLLFDGQGFAGLVLYWSLIGIVYVVATKQTLPFSAKWLYLGIGVLLLVILFRDILARTLLHQETQGEKESLGMQAFDILHNLMSFLSNTASFVRLAAFALNHVGLSLAVLAISDLVHKLPGGIVLKVITLILGNILILFLEGLIVFIQTLRLEYYEFFSKFYQGGGNVFKPVKWENEQSRPNPHG